MVQRCLLRRVRVFVLVIRALPSLRLPADVSVGCRSPDGARLDAGLMHWSAS